MMSSSRVSNIKQTPAAVLARKARKLASEGADIVNFASGDVDYPSPGLAVEAAHRAAEAGAVSYTNVDGDPGLKSAIADDFRARHGIDLRQDQIIVSTGSKQSLFGALFVSTSPGDEILIPAPYWSSYIDIALLAGCKPVVVSCNGHSGYKLTPAVLDAAINPRTRWLILTSPGSPVGSVYDADDLRALGAVLAKYPRILVLFDELYEAFVFDGGRHVTLASAAPELASRIVTVGGVSKSYAMMGWRIGWAAGDPSLIADMGIVQSQITSSASTVGQAGAMAALRDCGRHRAALIEDVERKRHHALRSLSDVPTLRAVPAAGSIYLFVNIAGVAADDRAFCEDLLNQTGLVVLPGSDCGASGFFRINIARRTSDLESGLERLRKFANARSC
jgi:aspartate aminotransferase